MAPKRKLKALTGDQPDAKKSRLQDSAQSTDFDDIDAGKIANMSYDDLRLALKSVGECPGPINDSTR